MSAEEPAYIVEQVRCPRCGEDVQAPVGALTNRGLFALHDVACGCGWTGRVHWCRVIEEIVALRA